MTNYRSDIFEQGKGYPDLITRRFLRSYLDYGRRTYIQSPPFLGYFDCDRDGIAIIQTYCQGSVALAREQSSVIPEMERLEMRLNDVFEGAMANEPLLPLTLIDREWICAKLARQSTDLDNVQQQCRSKLQQMLVQNLKAEIRLLDD
jgi:DNA topoisomerase VI subunit A